MGKQPITQPTSSSSLGKPSRPCPPMAETTTTALGKCSKKSHHCAAQKGRHKVPEKPSSWGTLQSLFKYKYSHAQENRRPGKRIGCSGSLCNLRESSKVMQRPETSSPEDSRKRVATGHGGASSRSLKAPLNESSGPISSSTSSLSSSCITASSSSSSAGGSFTGLHLSGFSGCYECRMVVDPITGVSRHSSLRSSIRACPCCGEVFTKPDSLELHQAIRHAVVELALDDTSRNVVEIIFQSSWLKKGAPVCKIERILKVQNTQKTIAKFEDYRDSIKTKASKFAKKYPRCIADGNELLRFHCTSFTCSIGVNGSTNLCQSIPICNVCSIIRDGFKVDELGKICTMAASGRAHDAAQTSSDDEKRAMLVCRVIAGRVKKNQDALEEYDSIAGVTGFYSDKLCVFNPRAILPCFIVIYGGF